MSLDPLLPIAPARVKALVLPIGQVKRPRFAAFVERLQAEHVVHLRDISADGRPNRNMFSPLAFPGGAIFYELVDHLPPPSHLALSPFDLYREPLAIIAVADGPELEHAAVYSKRHSGGARTVAENNIRALYQELEGLRDAYPKALVHRVLIFDFEDQDEKNPVPIPEGLATVPPPEKCKVTTMKTLMCDVSSLLLAEMTTLARSLEARPYIESPGGQSSSPAGQVNGSSDTNLPARRNSQFSLPFASRSTSASSVPDKAQMRMSMPVPPKASPLGFGSSSSTPARPSTPVRSGLSNPPTTFDDIENGPKTASSSPDRAPHDRPGTAEGLRAQSHDRVSVQGFGSGGVNDKWRNKGKERVTIVIGSLYLQAGRWSDSLRELVEGATVAKSINDHLWYGKALELIMVNLLLLGWAGIEFQIPHICFPPPEKGASYSATPQNFEKADHRQPRWLLNLQAILPDLLDRILASYSRVTAEHLPPLPLSEATIRFCKIMTALHVSDGQLSEQSLQMMVFGKYPERPLSTSPRLTVIPARTHIVTTLFRAFPASSSELLTTVDRIVILSGISSVLGTLGFQRKKAMVVRELVSVLIGGLVEARMRGAADVGIHPAAGLASLNGVHGQTNGAGALDLREGDMEHGMQAFLGLLLKTYGVVSSEVDEIAPGETNAPDVDSDESVISRIQAQTAARVFGMPHIKLNVLRACVNFAEALPDFAGVLKFSSDLLRTAGKGIAPGPRREEAYPVISKDEQARLSTNISKTSNLSKRLGLEHLSAEYWDEFLVRGLKLEPLRPTRFPIEHRQSELPGAEAARASQDVNPFIHNPFLKEPDKKAVENILLAGEPATFRLTLQNPYEIDVEIESIRLDTEGIQFESAINSTVIGPYRTQVLKLTGTPRRAGQLRVTGAVICVRGCRERRFPIFSDPWAPSRETKIKAIGLAAFDGPSEPTSLVPRPLKADSLGLSVLAEQPVVVIKSTTLPQSSIMVLEGERQTFSVTLHNSSTTTPVDFLLFSFQDSTQEPLQNALSSRDATPAELYEYELILARKQAFRIKKKDAKRYIAPGETATFGFEVLGKPGLTDGTVKFDYAHLGVPHEEIEGKFYTRQVCLQMTVTVNASVEVARMDILPLHGSIPKPLWVRAGHGDEGYEEEGLKFTSDNYCLLLLDLRNAWPSDMLIRLEAEGGATIEENILPGNTSRVILPIKRIYLEDPHAPIPALNPSRQRQYVVSTTVTPEAERANRESFWYREKMLDSLKGSWRSTSGPRRGGTIELRNIRLTPRMIEVIKIDEVGIDISVQGAGAASSSGSAGGSGKDVVFVDEFFQVRVRITNRTEQPIHPMLRLLPALSHRPLGVALDYTRKLAWDGALQRPLAALGGGESADVVLGCAALCRGEFEVAASVEETQVWRPATEAERQADDERRTRRSSARRAGRRPRSNTQDLVDSSALGARERRIWHSRRPCYLVARDRE